jgi:hypothetical protein
MSAHKIERNNQCRQNYDDDNRGREATLLRRCQDFSGWV